MALRDEPLGKQYWAHHNSAANFAVANRHLIVEGVSRRARRRRSTRAARCTTRSATTSCRRRRSCLPDGTTKRGFVHRKGATRAFPAGHPDLAGTAWETTGHPCLIPGSMLDGAAILFPLAGASKRGFSVNHGSGRLHGPRRGQARARVAPRRNRRRDAHDRRARSAASRSAASSATPKRTPLDECGHVYKDLDAVLAVLEERGNRARGAPALPGREHQGHGLSCVRASTGPRPLRRAPTSRSSPCDLRGRAGTPSPCWKRRATSSRRRCVCT